MEWRGEFGCEEYQRRVAGTDWATVFINVCLTSGIVVLKGSRWNNGLIFVREKRKEEVKKENMIQKLIYNNIKQKSYKGGRDKNKKNNWSKLYNTLKYKLSTTKNNKNN